MDLTELLKTNPAAAAEIDRIKADAKAEGRKESQAEYSARVDKVLPIIQSAAYPANIKTIACNVLVGKEEMAAFTATVATFDTMKEAAASASAQEESAALGSVSAEEPDLKGGSDTDKAWEAAAAAQKAQGVK